MKSNADRSLSHSFFQQTNSHPIKSIPSSSLKQLQQNLGNQQIAQLMTSNGVPTFPFSTPSSSNLHHANVIQPKLTHTTKNKGEEQQRLYKLYENEIENFAKTLSDEVDKARELIETGYFLNIPAIDGYMSHFLENFDESKLEFKNKGHFYTQAGYWIESYVTKIINPQPSGGLKAIHQATRDTTRPDVILVGSNKKLGIEEIVDIAWLDITSDSNMSSGHIWTKIGNWNLIPYVTEVNYKHFESSKLNISKKPDINANLQDLADKAKQLQKEQLQKEDLLLEKHATNLVIEIYNIINKVKIYENLEIENSLNKSKVSSKSSKNKINQFENQSEEEELPVPNKRKNINLDNTEIEYAQIKKMKSDTKTNTQTNPKLIFKEDSEQNEVLGETNTFKSKLRPKKINSNYFIPDDPLDEKYASHYPGNEYEKAIIELFTAKANRIVTPLEVASFILRFNDMINKYEKRHNTKLSTIINKNNIGLEYIEASGADGEALVWEWME